MSDAAKKYRFILIQAFQLPESSPYRHRTTEGPKKRACRTTIRSHPFSPMLNGTCIPAR